MQESYPLDGELAKRRIIFLPLHALSDKALTTLR